MKLQRRTLSAPLAPSTCSLLAESLVPGLWLVQGGCAPPPAHAPSRLLAGFAADRAMALTLRTDSLLENDIGPLLSERLQRSGCGVGDLAGLALHEILVNAAVHGNLQVASEPAALWRARAVHAQQIDAGLADPIRAARLVTVALGWNDTQLCACIIDEGAGYTPSPACRQAPSHTAAGRGLAIARAAARVDVLRGGRCTRMIFERLPAMGAA